MSKVVFLVGAGASVDAGMPTVKDLTVDLRKVLPDLKDVNGKQRSEFTEIFDALAGYDSEVVSNYERFFEWIWLIQKVQITPFSSLLCTGLRPSLLSATGELCFVVGSAIKELLASRRTDPAYLARLADFIPQSGRLRVFSLNYDCCIEDACRGEGISVTTGFAADSGKWQPSLLSKERGIILHKLHGSLRWFLDRRSIGRGPIAYIENPDGVGDESRLDHAQCGESELVLGPGSKIQWDDPFLTLFCEFHRVMARARVCVIIGYGYKDEHVNNVLDQAVARGMRLVDVNPGNACGRYMANHYCHLRLGAKDALTGGTLFREVSRLAS